MPPKADAVTRYSPRLSLTSIGAAAAIYEECARLLTEARYFETCDWPYAFNRFDNGVQISARAREIHRELGEGAALFGDPFDTAHEPSFWQWVRECS